MTAQALADIPKDHFGGFLLQLNVAAPRGGQEAALDLFLHAVARVREKSPEFFLEIVPAVRRTDEIQNSQAVLAVAQAQSASELLEEDGQGFRGPQEKDGIHFRNVHAFIVQVYDENDPDLPFHKSVLRGMPLFVGGFSVQGDGGRAGTVEIVCHEMRVLDRDAESKGSDIIHIGSIADQAVSHMFRAPFRYSSGDGVDVAQGSAVIPAAAPFQAVQIHCVGDAEILERTEQLALNGFGKSDFRRDMVVEKAENGFPVHAFRGCREAEKDLRPEVAYGFRVGLSGSVMGFVYDDVVVIIRIQTGPEGLGIHGLDGNEQVIQPKGPVGAHPEVSEVFIPEHTLESGKALFQDFLTVGNEQKPVGGLRMLSAPGAVVQRGDHGFPGSGGSHQQIPVKPADFTVCTDLVQNGLLIGVGPDVKEEGVTLAPPFFPLQGLRQSGV